MFQPEHYKKLECGLLLTLSYGGERYKQLIRIAEIKQPRMQPVNYLPSFAIKTINTELLNYHHYRRNKIYRKYRSGKKRALPRELKRAKQANIGLQRLLKDETMIVELSHDTDFGGYTKLTSKLYYSYAIVESIATLLRNDIEVTILPTGPCDEDGFRTYVTVAIEYGPIVNQTRIRSNPEDLKMLSKLDESEYLSNPGRYATINQDGRVELTPRTSRIDPHLIYDDHFSIVTDLFRSPKISTTSLPDLDSFNCGRGRTRGKIRQSDPYIFSYQTDDYYLSEGSELIVCGRRAGFLEWLQSLETYGSKCIYIGSEILESDQIELPSRVLWKIIRDLQHQISAQNGDLLRTNFHVLDVILNYDHSEMSNFDEFMEALSNFDTTTDQKLRSLTDIKDLVTQQLAENQFTKQDVWPIYHTIKQCGLYDTDVYPEYLSTESTLFGKYLEQIALGYGSKPIYERSKYSFNRDKLLQIIPETDSSSSTILLLYLLDLIIKDKRNGNTNTATWTLVIDDLDISHQFWRDQTRGLLQKYLDRGLRIVYRVPTSQFLQDRTNIAASGSIPQLHLDGWKESDDQIHEVPKLVYAASQEEIDVIIKSDANSVPDPSTELTPVLGMLLFLTNIFPFLLGGVVAGFLIEAILIFVRKLRLDGREIELLPSNRRTQRFIPEQSFNLADTDDILILNKSGIFLVKEEQD